MKAKTRKLLLWCLPFVMAIVMLIPFAAKALFARADEPQQAEITEVSTFSQLVEAVNADKTHIKLMNTIEDKVPDDELPTKHRLLFDGGKDYVLDLNGYLLGVYNYANEFYSGNFSMIHVSNNSNLEIENGRIIFTNWYVGAGSGRTGKGIVFVEGEATLTATNVVMYNSYAGTVVYATDTAKVTIDGGDYTAMNGFTIYLESQAELTLDGGVIVGTYVGDSAATIFVDGYGALYSESTGALTINNAYFNTGIQIHTSQTDAFSVATHEVIINGEKQTEDVYMSDAGNQFAALEANKVYYWYKYGKLSSLYKVESTGFSNTVSVISYTKKYAIEVNSGTATVGGVSATEACYGQEVTITANEPEEGMEFVRWDTNGVSLANWYTSQTTFTMPAAPVYLAAYYAKESVKAVNATVAAIAAGQRAYDTEITLDGGVVLQEAEWYEDLIKMGENDIFKPGKTYGVKILAYPPNEYKFADSLTVTINGKSSTIDLNSQYAYINYTFETLAENPFPVVYNTQTAQLGIGGKLELDTALMSSQSSEFKGAFDAGEVAYQWYKNGEAMEGETDAVYNFTAEDVGSRFYVTVTAGGKTAWGNTYACYNHLFQIYLNASDVVVGGKAPQISSATPGVSIDPESLYICEGYGQPEREIQKTILIPGKTYLVIGKLMQTGEANIPNGANVYVNDSLMDDQVDSIRRFFYKFTLPAADYSVYYKANGEVGIGVTLTVDIEKMCEESPTFKQVYESANSTYQTVFYQWYKNGEEIKGATDISYTVKTTDRDSYIHCKVTLVDGKYGIGEQQIITNVITVLDVKLPTPKNGEEMIKKESIKAEGVETIGVFWTDKETEVTMITGDTYEEGKVYELYVQFQAKESFLLDFQGDMTIAYIYGEKAGEGGSVPNSGKAFYLTEVTAIHKHQYSDTVWNFDEYSHWQPCIVQGCPNPDEEYEGNVEHWGGGATCKTEGVCTQCGTTYTDDHDFSIPLYKYVDDMKCYHFCNTEGCDATAGWSYHEGGVATCESKSICEICHTEYGKVADHAGGKATCKAKAVCDTCGEEYGEMLAHTGGKATCIAKAVCDACGEGYGEFAKHSFAVVWTYKAKEGHAHGCTVVGCTAYDELKAHTPDRAEATETEGIVCSDCDYVIEPALGHVTHTPRAEWASNATHHWHGCTGCEGQELEKAEHKDEDSNNVCDVCEYQLPVPEPTPNPNPNPNPTPNPNPDNTPNTAPQEEKKGLSGGAIAGIVIGSVAVAGVGGFALVWFVVKKKTWADFVAIFKKK